MRGLTFRSVVVATPMCTALLAVLSSGACGPHNPVTSPDKMRFVDDTDPERARVSLVKKSSAPMVVDWNPENRADLEVTARRGPALVHFDATTFELLPDCRATGGYSYVGVTPKEQHVTMTSRAELQTNLPLGAFKLEGMLSDKGALSVDMRMVGKQVLDRPTINRTDLSGKCAQATHYVSALTVGAFRFASGSSRAAGVGAGALGVSAGASSEKGQETLQTDGDFASCDGADPGAAKSPSRCSAILRIEIVPIERDTSVAIEDDHPKCGDGMRWNGESCVTLRRIEAEEKSRPEGAPAADGHAAGFECDPKNGAECVAQCRAGNLASCVTLGWLASAGASEVPKDADKAQKLWAVACKASYAPGCTALAGYFQEQGKLAEALTLGKSACLAGDPAGCNAVAVQAFFGRGVREDRATAYELWVRACALRDWTSCSNAGVVLHHGFGGIAKDQTRSRALFQLACSSPAKSGCANLGNSMELGEGGPADVGKAMELYLGDCERGQAYGCVMAGMLAEERATKAEHRAKAVTLFEKGCGYTETGGCLSEADARSSWAGKYSEEGIHRRSCDGAAPPALACYDAALAHEHGYAGRVDLVKADGFLKQACQAGLKKACRAAHEAGAGTTAL